VVRPVFGPILRRSRKKPGGFPPGLLTGPMFFNTT
jgi:hypothetical protein